MTHQEQLKEELAKLEHEQWMEWSKNLHSNEKLSPERIDRWTKMWIPYSELTEEQKDQDRVYAEKSMALFMAVLEEIIAEGKEKKLIEAGFDTEGLRRKQAFNMGIDTVLALLKKRL